MFAWPLVIKMWRNSVLRFFLPSYSKNNFFLSFNHWNYIIIYIIIIIKLYSNLILCVLERCFLCLNLISHYTINECLSEAITKTFSKHLVWIWWYFEEDLFPWNFLWMKNSCFQVKYWQRKYTSFLFYFFPVIHQLRNAGK